MPMRYGGSKGGIAKSYRPSGSQMIARTTAMKVIDLTQESEGEVAGREPEAESEESKASEGTGEPEEHEHSDAENERFQRLLATQVNPGISYSVTRHRHRPWGGGDTFGMVGIFNTEEEAKQTAIDNYMKTCEAEADGWEYYWWRHPNVKEIQLRAHIEDGEAQQDTYRGTINRVQLKEKPSALVRVYVVQEERRKVENELDSLLASRARYIYREGLAANGAAQKLYESYFLRFRHPKTINHEIRDGLLSIILEDRDKQISYSITVEERHLR